VFGVVADVLAMISGILRENWLYAIYGTGLGASTVLFYFFWWVALVICGVMLLIALSRTWAFSSALVFGTKPARPAFRATEPTSR